MSMPLKHLQLEALPEKTRHTRMWSSQKTETTSNRFLHKETYSDAHAALVDEYEVWEASGLEKSMSSERYHELYYEALEFAYNCVPDEISTLERYQSEKPDDVIPREYALMAYVGDQKTAATHPTALELSKDA